MTAVGKNDYECTKLLISDGADVNKFGSDCTGRNLTALLLAAANRSTDFVKILVTAGADVNAEINDGFTALSYAASYGQIELINLLVSVGAHVNNSSATARHSLPLIQAVNNNEIKCVEKLIELGADVNRISSNGGTELHEAAKQVIWYEKGHECVRALIQAGVDLVKADNSGNTALLVLLIRTSSYIIWKEKLSTPPHRGFDCK